MNETRGFTTGQMLCTLLVGAAAGAAIALLTAPRTGRETREALGVLGRRVRNKAASLPHMVRHASEQATHAGKEAYRAGKEAFKESLDADMHRPDA